MYENTFLEPNGDSPNTSDKSFPAVGKTDAEISLPSKEPEIENTEADGCESIAVEAYSSVVMSPSASARLSVPCSTPMILSSLVPTPLNLIPRGAA